MSDAIPVIKLWNQLVVPLQGEITDTQASKLSEDILSAIQRSEPGGLAVDVSGVAVIDSHLCAVIARLASAASLMGTRVVISGLKPEIVITLLSMDLDLSGVTTTRTLEGALSFLGVRKAGVQRLSPGHRRRRAARRALPGRALGGGK